MAKRLAIPSQHVELRVVGPKNYFSVSRVQRLGLNTDIPTTDVFELGAALKAGTTQDTPAVTLTFSAMDVGIKVWSVLTGSDPLAFPVAGVALTSLGEADAVIHIKDEFVSDYVKSGHARRMQVRDFTFNYSVDGESTEDYTLVGSEKRWFKNDVIVDRFGSGAGPFTLSQTPILLKNGHYGLSVIADGVYLTEVAALTAAGQYVMAGTSLTVYSAVASQIIAIYHANPTGPLLWSDVSDPLLPGAIRGKDVNVNIALADAERIQSVTINGNLNVQNVKEMGNRDIVGYQKQTPTVDGTITVLDTDTDLINQFSNGYISADTEFQLSSLCPTSGVALKIQLRDPCDSTSPYAVLKTVYLDKIIIVGDAFTSNVNNNATQTWNWRSINANLVVYSGVYGP
jgi:hypothetical protein